jgi:hypothetical protein
MTTETTIARPPEAILRAARDFFLAPGRMADAWIESESDTHVSFCTFRGNLAIGVSPDAEDPGRTRVRVTTLRQEGLVPRLITYLTKVQSGAEVG